VGAELFHSERKTDRHDETIGALFTILRKAPEKSTSCDDHTL
jgi:hypothetical protein